MTGVQTCALPIFFASTLLAISVGGTNYFHCKPRFLLSELPLFTVPARWWSAQNRVIKSVVAVGVILASTFWNAYLIAVWPISV